ncbi:hypothetical protein CEJ46_07935 [Vibrio anguillarum]|nr:hypothetical protein CEJ46_07935 [Vibrio anguillarum]
MLPLDDALEAILTRDVSAPVRHHHTINAPKDPDATKLLMLACGSKVSAWVWKSECLIDYLAQINSQFTISPSGRIVVTVKI